MSVKGLESHVQDAEAGWTTAVSPAPEPVDDGFRIEDIEAEPEASTLWPKLFAGLLSLLALGWPGASAYAVVQAPPAGLAGWLGWVAGTSMPLVLLGIVWLAFGRTGRRETERFTRAVTAMRGESQALETVLA